MTGLKERLPTIFTAVLMTLCFVVALYLVFKLVGFSTTSFESTWIAVPTLAISVSLTVANWQRDGSLRDVAIQYAGSHANWRVLSFFLVVFLIWGLAQSIGEWSVGSNTVDHGACSRFGFGGGYPCGTEDLNAPAKAALSDLIDKFASAFFIVVSLSLIHPKVRLLIGGEA
jgi:hypothetical protein